MKVKIKQSKFHGQYDTYPCALVIIFLIVLNFASNISGIRWEPNSAMTSALSNSGQIIIYTSANTDQKCTFELLHEYWWNDMVYN